MSYIERVLSEEEIRNAEVDYRCDETFTETDALVLLPNLFATIRDLQRQVSDLMEKITAPNGFETDIIFYCNECGEEAIRCEGCRKWICGDCNERRGGNQWFCSDCDEHAPRQEEANVPTRETT